MAVTLTDSDHLYGAGEATRTVNVTVGADSTRALAVIHCNNNGTLLPIASITFNGSGMTIVGSRFDFASDSYLVAYSFDVSALNGNYDCIASISGGVSQDLDLAVYVFDGADTPTNFVTDTGATTTLIDIAVTTAAGGYCVWAISQDVDADLTPNGGETELYDNGGAWYFSSGYYETTSGGTTTSNLAMTSGAWSGVGLFIPAAAGGSAIAVHRYLDRQRRR